jgi:signal transduction histidine kinase
MNRASAALQRLQGRSVAGLPVLDIVLALALCATAVASVLTGNPDEGPVAVTAPVAVVSTLALAWRVRAPIVCVAVLIASGITQTLLASAPGSLWSLVVYAIAMYSLAAHNPEGRAALVGAVFVAALLVQERLDDGIDFLFIVLLFGGHWLLGRASRHWRRRVRTAERRQRDAARLAIAQERVRIARELHDVVAHSLTVIAVQSDAAEAAIEADAARAGEPIRAIGATARRALTEIRSLLDVLRADDADLPGTRSPGLSAVDALVETARATGVDVDVTVQLTAGPVPAAIDLVAYRVVQESLTNILTHAPGSRAAVTIAQRQRSLRIAVRNTAATGPERLGLAAGYGLTGLRERVHSVGGRVTTAPTPDGGFAVDVDIPLPAPVPAEAL